MDYAIYAVRVFVTDWPRALEFYTQTLGMRTALAMDGWAEFDTGAAHLAIERVDPADPEARTSVGRFVGVSLSVPDVDAAYRALTQRGVVFVAPPERQPWGGVLAHFKDPDDNVLSLLGR